jgi:predicted metal-dependent phosphoesterase TrpH
MPEHFCDLHTHSRFSDGTLTPTELVTKAKSIGLSAVALTDHNTISGLSEFIIAGQKQGLEVIPGCELSTDYDGIELHLVGLFIRPQSFSTVSDFLEEGVRQKKENTLRLIEALRKGGMSLDYDEIKSKAGGEINRAHIASELCEKGYAKSVDDAFRRFLDPKHGYYKKLRRVSTTEAIGFIRSLGAVPILAHPLLDLDELELLRFLPSAIDAGLCGIETDYTKFNESKREALRNIADSFGICKNGGSDFHGERKPDVALGTGHGDLKVPYEYLQKLKKLAR